MKKELNFELLKSLYKVFSPSMNEKKMRRFIKRHVNNNIGGVTIVQDKTGNLLITKGESDSYPCICAHMDQVQHLHPKDFTCVENDDVIFGYSPKERKQCGLGADDKNGLFIALECLASYDVIKCAFLVGEEIGCKGSGAVDVSFFDDCRYCIQIDRRGNSDMVTSIYSEMCSEEFINDVDCLSHGYEISDGLMTDVAELREKGVGVSCINLSCGYYEPHTDYEFTSKSDLQKCYDFVCHIIENCTKKYEYEYFRRSFYNSFGHSQKSGDRNQYWLDLVHDDIYDYLSFYENAEFGEVLDCLSYNGLTDCVDYDDVVRIYDNVKAELKKEAELEEV